MLKHFAGREAVVVLFAWPTAENFLRYARDLRTALGSAPQLADLVRLLAARTAAREDRRLHLLRRRHRRQRRPRAPRPRDPRHRRPPRRGLPRRPRRRLPRLRRRPRRLRPPARRVTAAVNLGDSALRLARRRQPRLPRRPPRHRRALRRHQRPPPRRRRRRRDRDRPGPPRPHARALRHLAHLLVRPPLGLQRRPPHPPLPPPPATRALDPATAPSGAAYWTFPEDYPARMPAVVDAVRAATARRNHRRSAAGNEERKNARRHHLRSAQRNVAQAPFHLIFTLFDKYISKYTSHDSAPRAHAPTHPPPLTCPAASASRPPRSALRLAPMPPADPEAFIARWSARRRQRALHRPVVPQRPHRPDRRGPPRPLRTPTATASSTR